MLTNFTVYVVSMGLDIFQLSPTAETEAMGLILAYSQSKGV